MNRILTWIKDRIKLLRSMRLWLFVMTFAIGLLPCIMLSHVLLSSYERKAIDIRTANVANQLHIISDHLITNKYLQVNSSESIDAELSQLSNLYNGRILIIDQDLRIIKDTYGISQNKTIVSQEVIRALRGETVSNYDNQDGYIEISMPIIENVVTDDNESVSVIRGVMITSVSSDTIMNTQDSLRDISRLVNYLVAVALFVIAVSASAIVTIPLKRLVLSISDVKEGYTSNPVMVRDYLETENISDAFNSVLARLKMLDDSRQEFVANVSHELKTPMTSMKVLADSLLAQDEVPAELYKEFMGDITREIDRENQIISDLLSLVKMDKTTSDLYISQVDINALIELVLKRLRPIARKKNVEIEFVSMRQVSAMVDEVKISLVITNLVENAIKYNNDNGSVRVTLDADHQFFTLQVEDTGIGIPEDSREQIFERFYRVDKSHSREIGGTGLGLAITKSAILMHRGTITVDSVEGEGSTFTVKIPLVYIPQGK